MRKAALTAGLFAAAFITVAPSPTAHAETQTETKKPNMVKIVPGDSLSKIANAHDTTYHRLFDANTYIKNPDLIYPGNEVRIPTADEDLTKRELPATAPARPVEATKPATTTRAKQQPQRAKPVATAPKVASGSVWDRLAACESGGNWRINTGNGYYGGLQFSAATWRSVGGTGLPHQHSRDEQIKRAQILLDRAGWGQWPACTKKLGLR